MDIMYTKKKVGLAWIPDIEIIWADIQQLQQNTVQQTDKNIISLYYSNIQTYGPTLIGLY